MQKGNFKKAALEFFQVLGVTKEEGDKLIDALQRKLSWELLISLESEFSPEENKWIHGKDNLNIAGSDPRITTLREKITKAHTPEDLNIRSLQLYKKILLDYIASLKNLEGAKKDRLEKIVDELL